MIVNPALPILSVTGEDLSFNVALIRTEFFAYQFTHLMTGKNFLRLPQASLEEIYLLPVPGHVKYLNRSI